MLYLQKVCKNITVDINSEGGSVLDGYSISSAIYNSKVPVTTRINGLAASTALWCAGAGSIRKAKDYATGMIHGSSGGSDKDMTDLVDKTINIQLSNRSNKTPEEIAAMMSKETWMNAKEMLEMGIIDEIEDTGRKVKIPKSKNLAEIANIYNSLTKPQNMSKINTLLKISNNADESEQETAIAKLNSDLAKANDELTEAKNKLATLEAEKTAKEAADLLALKNEVTTFVNAAEKAGKIKKDLVNTTIENASKDRASFEFTKNLIGEIPSMKDAAHIFNPMNVAPKSAEGETYAKLEVENPDRLVYLYKNDRPKYDELLNEYKTGK